MSIVSGLLKAYTKLRKIIEICKSFLTLYHVDFRWFSPRSKYLKSQISQMKLSKNFTLAEFSLSETAKKLGISNVIPTQYVPNIKTLVEQVLQPAREVLGVPIMVTSGYRCPALNRAVGGVQGSQHTMGEAADLVPADGSVKTLMRLFVILMDGAFDQLILEHKSGKSWIHVSYRAGRNRQQVLLG